MTAAVPLVERLAEALAGHEYALEMRRGSICLCGFIPTVQPETLQTQQDYHRAHVARALLPVVEQAVAGAREEAWDEGYLRGTLDTTSDLEPADNPYRGAIATTEGAE